MARPLLLDHPVHFATRAVLGRIESPDVAGLTSLLRTALQPTIVLSATRIALVVGSILNLVNQGGSVLDGQPVDWSRAALNYVVPYCVASFSAARQALR